MPASSVQEFFAKVETDKKLQKKLSTVHEKVTKDSKAKAAAAVVKIASAAGFKFTAKDLAKTGGAKGRKASASQMADVTGQSDCGYGTNYFCNAAWQCGYSTYH